MTDKEFVFAVPYEVLEGVWNDLFETVTKDGRTYKHLLTYEQDGNFILRVRNKGSELPLEAFRI